MKFAIREENSAIRGESVFRVQDGHPSRRQRAPVDKESIMSAPVIEPTSSPQLMLSTRLVSELGDPRSTLRATTDRSDAAVIISAGGEIDACNERTWRRLVSEAASVVVPP